MAECVLLKGGAGVFGSDECTATIDHVLKGYKAITKDSDDAPIEGSIVSKAEATYYAKRSGVQTIAAGQYLSGDQTIEAIGITSINANAHYGSGTELNTFTMPRDGTIVYGGLSHIPCQSGTVICEVAVNDTVITDMNWPNAGNFYERVSTVNKIRDVAQGDVISVKAYVSEAHSSAQISCVCIY
jgi:hypothetical protein